jgi:flavin-dependent dehydrogenase
MVLQTASRNGWFWYIPLHNNIVSVGVVAPFDYLFKNRENPADYEKTYCIEVGACSAVKERVSSGRRVAGFFATKDYSYRATRVAGDGWVVIGEEWGFLDPLYSSGVLLALRSGEMAADAIVEGLRTGDTSAAQLGKWGPEFNRGVDRMRRLVCEYYDGFSFGNFVKHYPDLRGTVTDLLIGDLFTDRVDKVWQPMESLYPPDKRPIPMWDGGTPMDGATGKANELRLPEGWKP